MEMTNVAVAKGKTRITVTLDADIYQELSKRAKNEHRTLSGQIRHELHKCISTTIIESEKS